MLTDLLEDLAGQRTATADYEVLVIDSEAGVDVSDIVNEFAASGLTISHHLADNVLAAKRNAGARRAAGTHLIFLDDDLRVGPDFVNDTSGITPSRQISWSQEKPTSQLPGMNEATTTDLRTADT